MVGIPRQTDGFLLQAGGSDFGGERPAELSGRELGDERPSQGEHGLSHANRFVHAGNVDAS